MYLGVLLPDRRCCRTFRAPLKESIGIHLIFPDAMPLDRKKLIAIIKKAVFENDKQINIANHYSAVFPIASDFEDRRQPMQSLYEKSGHSGRHFRSPLHNY